MGLFLRFSRSPTPISTYNVNGINGRLIVTLLQGTTFKNTPIH